MITIIIVALGLWGYSAYRGWNDAVVGVIPKLLPRAQVVLLPRPIPHHCEDCDPCGCCYKTRYICGLGGI